MDKTIIPSQIDLVAQILKLTQEDKVLWQLGGPDSIGDEYPNERIDAVFLAKYKGTTLKLVSIANRNLLADLASVLSTTPGVRTEPVFVKANVLELLNEQGRTVWKFPRMNVIDDLERSVRYQVANIKGFIENIFAEA